jgi:hypothetical protein
VKTKTRRVSRTQPAVYPFGLGGDPVKDPRNAPARAAYGDEGIKKLVKSWGSAYVPGGKKRP